MPPPRGRYPSIAGLRRQKHHRGMRIVLLLTGILMAGCQQASEPPVIVEDCSAVPRLDPAKAILDARAAWRRDDRHLLGVYGYVAEVPGVESPTLPVRMLDGTSDGGCPEQNRRARRYAATYNSEITRLAAM